MEVLRLGCFLGIKGNKKIKLSEIGMSVDEIYEEFKDNNIQTYPIQFGIDDESQEFKIAVMFIGTGILNIAFPLTNSKGFVDAVLNEKTHCKTSSESNGWNRLYFGSENNRLSFQEFFSGIEEECESRGLKITEKRIEMIFHSCSGSFIFSFKIDGVLAGKFFLPLYDGKSISEAIGCGFRFFDIGAKEMANDMINFTNSLSDEALLKFKLGE